MTKEIKNSLFSGVKFTALAQYSNVFINLFIGAILARLLTPEEFGTVAMVTVFVTFFSLFSDMGISVGIVQYKNLTTDNLSSVFNLSLLIGFLLATGFWFSSYLIADFYDSIEYIQIGKVLSITLFFKAASMTTLGVLRREQKFKQIGIIMVSASFFTGIVGIILAFAGFSYWALIIRSVLSAIYIFIFQYIVVKIPVKPILIFKGLGAMLRYSFYNFLFQFVNFFSRNLDNVLIGKYLGAQPLGYYEKSYRVMKMPLDNFTTIIAAVIHPVLSNHSRTELVNIHVKLVKLLAVVGIPISVLLFHFRSEVITVLFGNQWGPSTEPFKWLALSVWIQMILASTGGIFQASGKINYYFLTGAIAALVTVAAIIFGIMAGTIEKVGFFLLFAFIINFFQGFFILYKFVLKIPLSNLFQTLKIPFITGIVVFFAVFIPERMIVDYRLQLSVKAAVFMIMLLISYYVAGYFKFLSEFVPLKSIFRKKSNRKIE